MAFNIYSVGLATFPGLAGVGIDMVICWRWTQFRSLVNFKLRAWRKYLKKRRTVLCKEAAKSNSRKSD